MPRWRGRTRNCESASTWSRIGRVTCWRSPRTVFAESETRALESAAEPERERLFYAMWTVKEALAKALRLDLMDALRSCELIVDGPQWRARAPTPATGCISVYQPRTELTLSVVSIGASVPIETWSWPPQRPASWPLIAAIAL